MRRTLSLLLGLEEVLRKRLSVLVVMAAIGAGLLLVGAAGSKVQASQPEHSRGDSSNYFAHQQGHKGGKGHKDGLDPALQNKLEAAFEKSFRDGGAPGAIAAIRTPQGTWVSTRGVADLSSGEPMRAEMHHRIGSVTKTFTATLLLQAEAEGLLSLDDTIDQYVKGVPNGDEITLRQMANMTSGLADYSVNEQFMDAVFSHPERVWTPQEVVRIGIEDSPIFDPGTDGYYSNTNYILLGLVLEQVTGKPLERLYSKQIIKPLHLKETSFPDAEDSSIPEPHAQGYVLQSQDAEPLNATDWNPSWGWAAGGMISTADDMLLYGRALGTGKGLLPPKQQAERLDSFIVNDIFNGLAYYGLGLTYDRGWIGHGGDIPGYNTQLFYHPDLDATVVVEVNSNIAAGGNCPEGVPTLKDGPKDVPCDLPAHRIFTALAEALGKPATPIPGLESP
jgi:D-alanyl-D-alanine carboxypeptidase